MVIKQLISAPKKETEVKQRIFLGLVAVALLCATPVPAKDNKGKEEAKQPAATPVETAR